MGAVQRLATVVIIGLVALATVLVLYLADESNRIKHEQTEQQDAAIERGRENFLTLCLQCHGPAGEGYTAAGEAGTGRIGAPIGGETENRLINQTGKDADGVEWTNADFGSGLEGRANYIRNRIINGQIINGTVLMPAFGEDKNGPLNDEQVEELIVFIQHNDWNETYNKAIDEYGGYPTAPPAATEAADDGAETPAPDAGGDVNAGPIDIDMLDTLQFSETALTIPANTDVVVNAHNAGSLPHSFVIEGQGIGTSQLAGGASESLTINLPPGTYTYICDVPGHKEAGMVGTLTVVDPAAAPADGGGDVGGGEQPPADEGAASSGPFAVSMTDSFTFEGVPTSIPANTDVQFDVTNAGMLPHSFVIEGQGIGSSQLASGATESVTVNLPPGTYTYICDVPGHKEAGMLGTLTVVDPAAAPADDGGGEAPADGGGDEAPAAEGEAATGPIAVSMQDTFQFEGVPASIPAGTDVQFDVTNGGALPHSFVVEGQSIGTAQLPSGGTESVSVNLPPGTYTIICDVPGHKEAGMVATLTVQ